MKSTRYITKWVILSQITKPLVFVIFGMALSAVFSLWAAPVIGTKIRRGMLLAGAGICLFGLCVELFCWFGPGGSFAKWVRLFFYNRFWVKAPWIFLLPGILFFYGAPRKAG